MINWCPKGLRALSDCPILCNWQIGLLRSISLPASVETDTSCLLLFYEFFSYEVACLIKSVVGFNSACYSAVNCAAFLNLLWALEQHVPLCAKNGRMLYSSLIFFNIYGRRTCLLVVGLLGSLCSKLIRFYQMVVWFDHACVNLDH